MSPLLQHPYNPDFIRDSNSRIKPPFSRLLAKLGCSPLAQRVNEYGLLNLEDAKTAQTLLPEAWCNDAHAFVTIWALFELKIAEGSSYEAG